MTNKTDKPSMKDRLDKARLKQQVKQEEIDLIDELTSLVPDSMVQLIPNDEEEIERQVSLIEQFFFEKYDIVYQKKWKSPWWRTSAIDRRQLTNLVKLLWLGYSVNEACQECGFSYMAYYRFLDKNPEFRETFNQVKQAYLNYLSRRNLATLLIEWDKDATFKWLEAHDPAFKKNPNLSITNTQNNLILDIPADRAWKILESIQKKAKILQEWRYGTITRTRPSKTS